MGIRYLNKFLKENAKKSIKIIHLSDLSGKKIAIDISIYMYKFSADNTLIENMYLMLTILRYYNIIPIFIFDGKPPPEKKELLQQRRKDKHEALEEYNKLKDQLKTNNYEMDENDKQEIIHNIENVKMLIQSYGATYYDAPGEADEMCAMLNSQNKVWGCLSEDMDMFVYGCSRVIRYFSLLNHTAVLYDLKSILEELNITQMELREICVLSGTDYNINDDKKMNIYSIIKSFHKYKKEKCEEHFNQWLSKNNVCIQDNELFDKICNMFDLNKSNITRKELENIKIINGPIEKSAIREILKKDGFLFPLH